MAGRPLARFAAWPVHRGGLCCPWPSWAAITGNADRGPGQKLDPAAMGTAFPRTHNALERAIRYAEANDHARRNVASLIRPPKGHIRASGHTGSSQSPQQSCLPSVGCSVAGPRLTMVEEILPT